MFMQTLGHCGPVKLRRKWTITEVWLNQAEVEKPDRDELVPFWAQDPWPHRQELLMQKQVFV